MPLFVCLALLGYCITLRRFSKWSIEHTPFFVISCVIVFLYAAAYAGLLKLGADVTLFAGWGLLAISPFFLMQEKGKLLTKYATPGAIISLFYLSLFLFLAHFVHFAGWDEFTHWGPHSKLVFIHNGFITASDVTINKSYPLGSALFQYLFFRFSGFSEGTAYIAQCLLTMAPLSALLSIYNWKQWRKALIAYSLTLFILLILKVSVGPIETLYMDGIVGIYFGAIMVAYFNSERRVQDILYLLPIAAAFTTFKLKLLPLILVANTAIACDIILSTTKNDFKLNNKVTKLLCLGLVPLSALAVSKSWIHYLQTIHVNLEWKLHLSLSLLKNSLFPAKGSIQYTVLHNFLHALIPTIVFSCIMLVMAVTAYVMESNQSEKRSTAMVTILLVLGMVAYVYGLLLLYQFSFGAYEAVHLASMQRYLGIFYIGWFLVTFRFLCFSLKGIEVRLFITLERIGVACCIIALSVGLFIHHLRQLNPTHIKYSIWMLRQPIIKIADAVKLHTKPNSKIFTVWQASSGMEREIMIYELTPRIPNMGCISYGSQYNKQDVWTCHSSTKKFLNDIKGFDYLLLAYTDQNFWNHYQTVLPNRDNSTPLITYNICRTNHFASFQHRGCHYRKANAYLFKISEHHGRLIFTNVMQQHGANT